MKKTWIALIVLGCLGIGCASQGGDNNNASVDNNAASATNNSSATNAPANNSSTPASNTPAATAAKFADVQTVLNNNCTGCHGGGHPKAGLDLTSYDGLMKGTREGPIVTAGDPDGSVIVKAITGGKDGVKKMPPGKSLAAADIATIEVWIKAGAKNG